MAYSLCLFLAQVSSHKERSCSGCAPVISHQCSTRASRIPETWPAAKERERGCDLPSTPDQSLAWVLEQMEVQSEGQWPLEHPMVVKIDRGLSDNSSWQFYPEFLWRKVHLLSTYLGGLENWQITTDLQCHRTSKAISIKHICLNYLLRSCGTTWAYGQEIILSEFL